MDGATSLLSGTFGASKLSLDGNEAGFESSLIVTFFDPGSIGTNYFSPGRFSATLGDIGLLSGHSWTTNGSATGHIESTVPEPSSLLLLGAGLLGLAAYGRKKMMKG